MSCHFLVLLSLTNATSLYRSKQKLSFVASHFLLQLVMLFHPDQYDYLDCRLVWLMGWTKAPFLLSEGLTHILPISPGPLYIDCLSPLGLLQSLTTMVAIKSRGHPSWIWCSPGSMLIMGGTSGSEKTDRWRNFSFSNLSNASFTIDKLLMIMSHILNVHW